MISGLINYDIISNKKYKEMFNYIPFESRRGDPKDERDLISSYQANVLSHYGRDDALTSPVPVDFTQAKDKYIFDRSPHLKHDANDMILRVLNIGSIKHEELVDFRFQSLTSEVFENSKQGVFNSIELEHEMEDAGEDS